MTVIEDIYTKWQKDQPDECKDKMCHKCAQFKTCFLLEELFFEVEKVKYLALGGRICPVCGINELKGKQTICSPRCRQRLHRANKYQNNKETMSRFVTAEKVKEEEKQRKQDEKRTTRVMLSAETDQKLVEYISGFKASERPIGIGSKRMREIEAGARVLTVDELNKLYITYPDTLRVLFGINY